MRKIDKLDLCYIRKEAGRYIRVNTEFREGQAIYNAAMDKFPKSTNDLCGTNVDPYYDDSRINIFLESLLDMNAE